MLLVAREHERHLREASRERARGDLRRRAHGDGVARLVRLLADERREAEHPAARVARRRGSVAAPGDLAPLEDRPPERLVGLAERGLPELADHGPEARDPPLEAIAAERDELLADPLPVGRRALEAHPRDPAHAAHLVLEERLEGVEEHEG